MADAEKADRLIKIQPAMRRIGKPQSIEQVRSHSLMREQAPILKNIASTPPPGGHIDSGAAVKQHLFTHGYAPFIRAQQTGNHVRSEEHTSKLQSLMRRSYAVFCLKKKKPTPN